MKRFECKCCGKYLSLEEEYRLIDHPFKSILEKMDPESVEVKAKFHLRFGDRKCGPVHIREFGEYWVQMESFLGVEI